MGLAGEGALVIWHDIVPEGRAEFYAWHGREHMPERVGIPGFRRGRRYAAIEGVPEFFNLYETATPEVLAGPDYRARVDRPTAWTMAAVKHFRGVSRSICRVLASHGRGEGGLVATWRYDVEEAQADAHRAAMTGRRLADLAASSGVAGAHLLVANVEASAVDNAERKARGEPNRIPRWVLLVEGWGDEAPFAALCETAGAAVLTGSGALGAVEFGVYRLQATCSQGEPPR
jgi:hypothetical protein